MDADIGPVRVVLTEAMQPSIIIQWHLQPGTYLELQMQLVSSHLGLRYRVTSARQKRANGLSGSRFPRLFSLPSSSQAVATMQKADPPPGMIRVSGRGGG